MKNLIKMMSQRDPINGKIIKRVETLSFPLTAKQGQSIIVDQVILRVTYTDGSQIVTKPNRINTSTAVKGRALLIISYNNTDLFRTIDII